MLDTSAKQGILKPIRLVLVDRQPIVLQGLKSVLGTQQDFDVVASASDGAGCLEAIRTLSPDVALIADTLTDLTASDILAISKAEKLSTRLVFFTESDADHDLTAAIAAGACSAISKYAAPGAMLRSLRLMAKSGVSLEQTDLVPTGPDDDGGGKLEKMLERLTSRERQIVRLVAEGMSNKEIARRLDVSQGTVKVHLHNIFQKLEITNRTVLATISWLQRTSGFSALALAFLAFAIADELKASEAEDNFPHDDGPGRSDEHAGFEVWKKAILAHLIISTSREATALTERDLLAKASQTTNPSAAMEALRAAEQLLGSQVPGLNALKQGGAAGSNTPSLDALLPRESHDASSGGVLRVEDHLPRLAFQPTPIPGGYGTFAAVAGALIYAMSDHHLAAQAHELDHTSIDSLLDGVGEAATTKLAAITHVDANQPASLHPANSTSDILAHDFGRAAGFVTGSIDVPQQDVRGQAGPDAASDSGQKIDGVFDLGPASGSGGDGLDQLPDGKVENVVHRSAGDTKSGSSDSVLDSASGPNRINLAAFGALACLHLTAAVKSIPPHTLAWIYDPATNQTIVYVNPTDRVLDVGDRALLEVHLQGIVSVANADVVHPTDGAAVAVTLEQLEQALISAAAIDETDPSESRDHASESSPGTAHVWSASADDGLSFQFAHFRSGSGTSAKSGTFARDSADTTEGSADASSVSSYGSSTAPAHGASPPATENLSSKSAPASPNSGAPWSAQNEIVPPGLSTADSASHGNSAHASNQGQGKNAAAGEAETESKPGNADHDSEQHSQAPDSPPGLAKKAEAGGADHGESGYSGKAVDPGESDPNAGNAEHGHASHDLKSGPVKAANVEEAEANSKPDHGVGHDKEHHSQAADNPPGQAEAGSAGHGNSDHSAKVAEAGESDSNAGNAEHGHAPHAGKPLPAKATDVEMAEANSKPDHGVGHVNEHHAQAADNPPGQAKKTESGGTDHSNSGHSAKAAETGESDPNTGNTEHSHAPHDLKSGPANAANVEMAEAESKPDQGVGHDKEHHSQAADNPPGQAKKAEAGGADHSNSGHSAKVAEAGESDSNAGNAEHDHAPHAGKPLPANVEMAEAESTPDHGASHDEHPSHTSDPASPTGKTADPTASEHGKPPHDSPSASPNAGTAEPSVVKGDIAAGGSPHQPPQSPAPEAQPGKSGSASSGSDRDLVFRFDSGTAPSTFAPAVELREHGVGHVTPGEKDSPQMITEIVAGALDEHAAHHGVNGPHHGMGPATHDWLI
ncbi:DNA-binding response regulator [Bradyrhizobium sp. WBOS7]|uniref:DNA-binding response regulator n=2 Tax=Nitrobacteraceae TaxID=41294 RepID=A0AAE9NH55_9BRAD|nr:DNA-binding response regulator [Bradyrhizobium sp. WBOS2]MDD1573546.1 DNA-binding response regulator [Bradyrhizobium sp. WBOS1]MDD1579377.1 DNA-binding response regulator [Bradyrhizobium sp. WBOS7]MDD1602042.1 DNA-binding response regulator [Bradyrhizobium sp. WBOS16]UUO39257.1 DNA-binding response regulator [Bradyrhizobium sp. WBOS01]UUO45428.1 DNA-binding response regulator [Bradyrhizobium sp. WBOS02]UUO57469.1 DNA-binding response regulator [Bradyrhizobium sp. WBOS07]UUO69889.1 DNA-bin